jgi:gliding motility-associated-like protein
VPSFTLPDVCLANATAQFTDASTLPGVTAPVFTYAWDFGDVNATTANPNTSTVKNPAHQFTAAGVYHIELTTTSTNGCVASVTKDFTVSGKALFTAVPNTCPGDVVVFTDRTDGATPASTSWLWDFGDGSTSGLQNPTHVYANSNSSATTFYTVTLTVTGHNGCSVTSYSQPIHINIRPTANFTPPPLSCETKTVNFTDTSTPGEGTISTWVWDFGDNTANSALQNPTHTYATAGTYTAKLTVTNNRGCISDTKTMTITVQPQPVADFPLPGACASDSYATFSAVQSPLIKTYQWVFGNTASDVASGSPTATGATVTKPISSAGTYYARLIVTTAAGCVSEVTKPYFVNGSAPVAKFAIQGDRNKLCSDNTVTLVNQANIPGGFDNGTVSSVDIYYDYANDKNTFVHYDRPAVGAVLPPHTYPVEYSSSHTYTVRMVAYSGQSQDCVSPEYVDNNVVLLPVPKLTFDALPNLCQDAASINLNNNYARNNGAAGIGKFYLDGSTTALANDVFDPASAGTGPHTINYVVTATNGGCSESLQQTINVEPIPTNVTAGSDKEVVAGESVILDGKANGSNLTYRWSPVAGLDDPTSPTPKASPQVDTKYTLTVTSTTDVATPCAETATVNVTVLHSPVPPNTFTPNNDNINDTWEIKYLDRFRTSTIKVFNRKGELVFTSVGYGIPWDGRYNGKDLPVGTYYYIIDPNHVNLKVTSGSVNLIR